MKLNIEALESRAMTAVTCTDPGMQALYALDYADSQISRTEMIGLFRQASADGTVNANELRDLGGIVAGANMASDVRCLARDVVVARPTASSMGGLLDKWFYGKDHPSLNGYQGIGYRPVNGSLFVNGVSSTDIRQGQTGDCYYLAALAALADKNGSAVSTMFKDNMDGTWDVRFYKFDGSRYVEDWVSVDRYLPTNGFGYSVFQSFGGNASNPGNELWAALAEKAYAQWGRGDSYAGLSGGYSSVAFAQVTGAPSASDWNINDTQTIMLQAVNQGKAVVVYRFMDAARTQGHAYFVKSYSNGLFYLYNPWGFQHLALTADQIKAQCFGFAVATRV